MADEQWVGVRQRVEAVAARPAGRWRWESDGAEMVELSRLAEPFPDQGPDPKLLEELLAQCPEEEDFDDIEDFDDAMAAWDER